MPPKKNPVAARIKKMMQADDDVGKIAQATPVLVSKALELFLEELMKSTTEIAVSHGAKTVSAGHLKACITGNEKFDFLSEIVEGVPDLPVGGAPEAKGKAKRERADPPPPVAGSLDDDDYGAPPPKALRPEPPGTLGDMEPELGAAAPAPAAVPEPAAPAPAAAPEPASLVGSLGGEDDAGATAPAPASFSMPTGTLGAEDDDYDDL